MFHDTTSSLEAARYRACASRESNMNEDKRKPVPPLTVKKKDGTSVHALSGRRSGNRRGMAASAIGLGPPH